MKILAFLQNQWFKNPERAAFHRARCADPEKWDRIMLFAGCLTGRRLKAAFGEDLCDQIIWANASPKIAGQSDGVFPADPAHIGRSIVQHAPEVILLFGKIAQDGYAASLPFRSHLYFSPICGPHPAARGASTVAELRRMAIQLRAKISNPNAMMDDLLEAITP